ncbi:hypothetical protein Tco_0019864 [Tanacetum coccineum]
MVVNLDPNAPYGASLKLNTPCWCFVQTNAPLVVSDGGGGVVDVMVVVLCGCGGGAWCRRVGRRSGDGGDVDGGVGGVGVGGGNSGGGVGCGGGSGGGWPESSRRGAEKWGRKGWG